MTPATSEELSAMRCDGAISTKKSSVDALRDVLDQLGDAPRDVALVFASMDHAPAMEAISRALTERAGCRHVVGCTGESIIGGNVEVEEAPALSVWTASLPGASITPAAVDQDNFMGPEFFTEEPRTLLLLADPFTFPVAPWFKHLADRKSKLRVIGGMASGSRRPGENRLVLDGRVLDSGGVGLLIDGPVSIRPVVSQGCRPIGRALIVTKAERNLIRELGRRPAIDVLREIYADLPPDDQERVQAGLHVGRVISEYQETFGRGDFLVRNVVGVDDAGAVAITDAAKVGQTIQFHVRDAVTADEDLRTMLASRAAEGSKPAGALIFSCNGRGARLFDAPDHDVKAVHDAFGPIPVGGFFAMGELGPVGGQNFVHGYTAIVVLFEPASSSQAGPASLSGSSSLR